MGARARRALLLDRLAQSLPDAEFTCADNEQALRQAKLPGYDLVLLADGLSDRPLLAVLSDVIARRVQGVIVLAEQPDARLVEQTIRTGAIDCLPLREDWLSATAGVTRCRPELLCERRAAGLEPNHERLRYQVRQLELRNAQLRELVSLDPLTGLYNRRHFNDMLDLLFAVALRHQQDLACLMFDLDNFKQVNDELGHDEGDRLLILAARTLKQNMRGGDMAARYGGDEFVVLLPQVSADQACHLAERLRRLFQQLVQARPDRPSLQPSLSVGVASRVQAHAATGRELVAAADAALCEAKRLGKSAVILAGRKRPGP